MASFDWSSRIMLNNFPSWDDFHLKIKNKQFYSSQVLFDQKQLFSRDVSTGNIVYLLNKRRENKNKKTKYKISC